MRVRCCEWGLVCVTNREVVLPRTIPPTTHELWKKRSAIEVYGPIAACTPWPTCIPAGVEAPVGLRGLTVRQFKQTARFTKRLCRVGLLRYTTHPHFAKGTRVLWTKVTMFEVCFNIVKPIIEQIAGDGPKCSWSTLVARGKEQRPRTFVSHSWEECFRDFVSTFEHLELDRGLTASDAVWICTFANNQFELVMGKNLSDSPFHGALTHAQDVALFLDHSATALCRSWCNFELAITTDTPRNRRRWKAREELAGAGGDLFAVDWQDVDRKLQHDASVASSGAVTDEQAKPMLLCTPAGLVGTQRVTSGPVLKALRSLLSSKAEATRDEDRRRIMNYVAHSYLTESAPTRELDGLEVHNGELALTNEEVTHADTRTGGKQEFAHEHALATQPSTARKFRMLDESIFNECEAALERRGLHAPSKSSERGGALTRRGWTAKGMEETGLTLAQLRDIEVLLRKQCEDSPESASSMAVDGRPLRWARTGEGDGPLCTARHLHGSHFDGTLVRHTGDWKGLLSNILPDGAPFTECLNDGPLSIQYYIIGPYDLPLCDVFAAIERHAEALNLSDRATYYLQLLIGNRMPCGPDVTYTVFKATLEGTVLLMGEALSAEWAGISKVSQTQVVGVKSRLSLWCVMELHTSDKYSLPWDITCSTGVLATSRPLANGKWESGAFDAVIAENLMRVVVSFRDAMCSHEGDRKMLLERIGGDAKEFDVLMTRRLKRSLAPVLRHAAYMDQGAKSLKLLGACSILNARSFACDTRPLFPCRRGGLFAAAVADDFFRQPSELPRAIRRDAATHHGRPARVERPAAWRRPRAHAGAGARGLRR